MAEVGRLRALWHSHRAIGDAIGVPRHVVQRILRRYHPALIGRVGGQVALVASRGAIYYRLRSRGFSWDAAARIVPGDRSSSTARGNARAKARCEGWPWPPVAVTCPARRADLARYLATGRLP